MHSKIYFLCLLWSCDFNWSLWLLWL